MYVYFEIYAVLNFLLSILIQFYLYVNLVYKLHITQVHTCMKQYHLES